MRQIEKHYGFGRGFGGYGFEREMCVAPPRVLIEVQRINKLGFLEKKKVEGTVAPAGYTLCEPGKPNKKRVKK